MTGTLYALEVCTIDGRRETLEQYRGQVLLIVNVASRCGYTPQYRGLEAVYRRQKDRGFAVLGFPCNQFGRQEPGTNDEIRAFCRGTYGVTFPIFGRIDVNGRSAHPLYRLLKAAQPGLFGREAIAWNFTKFLVGRDGAVLRRYGFRRTPESIEPDIEEALGVR